MTIKNVPSEANHRTGKVTALSALALLQRLTGTLVVGSQTGPASESQTFAPHPELIEG